MCTKKMDDAKIDDASQMWLFRQMLRISWIEKMANESILQALEVSRKLLNLINKKKLKYIRQVSRNQRTRMF